MRFLLFSCRPYFFLDGRTSRAPSPPPARGSPRPFISWMVLPTPPFGFACHQAACSFSSLVFFLFCSPPVQLGTFFGPCRVSSATFSANRRRVFFSLTKGVLGGFGFPPPGTFCNRALLFSFEGLLHPFRFCGAFVLAPFPPISSKSHPVLHCDRHKWSSSSSLLPKRSRPRSLGLSRYFPYDFPGLSSFNCRFFPCFFFFRPPTLGRSRLFPFP